MEKREKRWGWGLIGPGRFACEFAAELARIDRAKPVAVASRNLERAQEFARKFGFERAFGSYEELIHDPEVEIVYIVLPHVFHKQIAELALAAGKAVMCEKPLTPTGAESRALCATAEEHGAFLMEAMKTGFMPGVQQAKAWIEAGEIGEPRLLKADFTFPGPSDPEDRLMNPKLAGGSVLDVGIYPLYLSQHLFGEIDSVQALGDLTETGVDHTAVINLRHSNGVCSALTSSFQAPESLDATILGTKGQIHLPTFHAATTATLTPLEGKPTTFRDKKCRMLTTEIHAVMDALDEGRIESPGHTHEDSIKLADLMDEVLRQIHQQ